MSEAAANLLPVAWLESLALPGRHALPCRILPGPMEGITAGSFCRLMARRGLTRAWITPFIRVSTGVPRHNRLADRLTAFSGLPTIAQVMGTDIPTLCGTASALVELGVIGIDLNCACPSTIVVANGAGGACLKEPAWIGTALRALRQACPSVGISVKIRSGFADPAELPAIVAAVRQAAPDIVFMHYRTVAEGYRPVTDGWPRLARARAMLGNIPLIGSGDTWTAAEALRLHAESGVAGVAPARGLVRNPWLLQDIEAACRGETPVARGLDEKCEFLHELVAEAERTDSWRPGFVMEMARFMFGLEHPLFHALAAARSAPEMLQALAPRTAGFIPEERRCK